jgi:hypothetical protein
MEKVRGRPKGKRNTPEEVIHLLRQLLFDNEKLTGKELKSIVEERIKGVNLSVRTYQVLKDNEMSRVKAEKDKRIDVPWSLGTLKEHPLPPDAIPLVLEALNSKAIFGRGPTIRVARWISILYPVIKDKKMLFRLSWYYALHERINSLAGNQDYDTREFDSRLSNPNKLLNYFDSLSPVDYDTYKVAFYDTTGGINYMGPTIRVDWLVFYEDRMYVPIKKEGKECLIHNTEYEGNLDDFIRFLKESKIKHSVEKMADGKVYIRLSKKIFLSWENKEINRLLHNSIAKSATNIATNPD